MSEQAHRDETTTDKTARIHGLARKHIRIIFGQLITNLTQLAAPLVFATHRRTYRRALSRRLSPLPSTGEIIYDSGKLERNLPPFIHDRTFAQRKAKSVGDRFEGRDFRGN